MMIKREIGEKGQVVIPKDIREFLGLKARENIVFEVKDNEVILKKEEDPEKFLEEFFSCPKKLKEGISTREIKKLLNNRFEK